MPIVLSEWNLTPSTDPKEVAIPPAQEPTARHLGRGKASYTRILTELRSRPCQLVVAGGIVNPMGPTLVALVMLGAKRGANWNLYRLSLNPFGQELTRLRAVKAKEAVSPSSIIGELGFGIAGVPTFLVFGRANSEEIHASARQIALASNNLASTVDRLRRFPGNPWDRISEEMKSGFESRSTPDREAKDQDVQDYILMIFDEKNLREEIAAFKTAWQGSIEFQASSDSSILVQTAMPLSDVREAISILLGSAGENADGSHPAPG
jgi:hypothetical protein